MEFKMDKIRKIIKHELHESKIIRILTHTGLVDVTDDHSLLNDLQLFHQKY